MILKTDKAGKTLESWPNIEEAAKAIKVSPKVLKGHLKGKPPKLGGFVFKLQGESPATVDESTKEPKESEFVNDLKKAALGTPLHFKNYQKDKEGNREELKDSIVYAPIIPESFDSPRLPSFAADEPCFFKILDQPFMLDEFGNPVPVQLPDYAEKALGHTGIPPECLQDLVDMGKMAYHQDREGKIRYVNPLSPEVAAALQNARANGDSFTHVADVTPEEAAEIDPDWLLTPLQQRLKRISK